MTLVASKAQPGSTALLEAVDLACFRSDRQLFTGVSLELAEGEALQVHGPNGSGKTTLLRILCGLTLPSTGTVHWRGQDIASYPGHHPSEIVYVGHANGVKLELSALENLRVARALALDPTDVAPEAALEMFGLYGFEDLPAFVLSAGQRRRVALARLLMNRGKFWVLDEPFTALDRAGIATMEALLHEHLQSGGSAALTTHQPLRLSAGPAKEIHLFS